MAARKKPKTDAKSASKSTSPQGKKRAKASAAKRSPKRSPKSSPKASPPITGLDEGLLQFSTDPHFLIDRESGEFLLVDGGMVELTGYSREELLGGEFPLSSLI